MKCGIQELRKTLDINWSMHNAIGIIVLKVSCNGAHTSHSMRVVRSGNDLESLLVDDMGDVMDISEANRCEPPETVRDPIRSMLLGVHQLDSHLLLLLDLDRVLDVTCQGEATTV